jgi:hypothetical protein
MSILFVIVQMVSIACIRGWYLYSKRMIITNHRNVQDNRCDEQERSTILNFLRILIGVYRHFLYHISFSWSFLSNVRVDPQDSTLVQKTWLARCETRPRIFWTTASLFIPHYISRSRKHEFTRILASLEFKYSALCKNSRIIHPNQRIILLTNNTWSEWLKNDDSCTASGLITNSFRCPTHLQWINETNRWQQLQEYRWFPRPGNRSVRWTMCVFLFWFLV